jgi:long-chain acyl-CoA synthetase
MCLISNVTGHRFRRLLYGAIHKQFGGRLRMFVCGGSRLDPDLYEAFSRMGFPVYEGYGLTETSPVLTVNPPGLSRRGSVGKALPNVEIEIHNPNLEGVGEIWCRGSSVMTGYLNNPEATREVMVDGWFRTGDLGRLDEDGYLYITGRSKDLIVTAAGKNVYPDEIELRYRDLPYAKELCVFGMESDDGLGEAVHAVVVIDNEAMAELDRSSIEREIRMAAASVSESLPTHQRIAALHFWDRELPKTSTLKAKRWLIRDTVRAEGGGSGDKPISLDQAEVASTAPEVEPATPGDPEAQAAVWDILSKQAKRPVDAIPKDAHLLLDLGIDSIGKIDVLGEIEARFRTRIDDETASTIARVTDLLSALGDRKPVEGGSRDSSLWQRKLAAETTPAHVDGKLPAPLLPVRWLVRGSLSLFLKTYVRVKVRGRQNIPDTGPFILAPNHSSHLDSPAVLKAVRGKRRVWIAGAQDYFFNTRMKRFIFGKILDTIAFDRRADGVQGLRRCGAALSRGDGLLIYPEGTRSITGKTQPFKVGVAVLAMERRVPIVPVYIDRAHELLRKGQRFVRPGAITVTFGKPVYPPSPDETDDHYAAFQEVTAQVQSAVTAMTNGATA